MSLCPRKWVFPALLLGCLVQEQTAVSLWAAGSLCPELDRPCADLWPAFLQTRGMGSIPASGFHMPVEANSKHFVPHLLSHPLLATYIAESGQLSRSASVPWTHLHLYRAWLVPVAPNENLLRSQKEDVTQGPADIH